MPHLRNDGQARQSSFKISQLSLSDQISQRLLVPVRVVATPSAQCCCSVGPMRVHLQLKLDPAIQIY